MLASLPEAGLSADPTLALPPILPEWFALPLYAILRCIPDKLACLILMFAAMLPPLVAPWIGAAHCRVDPARHLFMVLCSLLALSWLLLGWLGAQEVTALSSWAVRILTLYYFCFFLVLVPLLGRWARHRQVLRDSRALSSFD
jgi:quinol-cytochrome oxidoreductase complex cytochrome b subunit